MGQISDFSASRYRVTTAPSFDQRLAAAANLSDNVLEIARKILSAS
jgi:hypothetical protein